jgi:hypothetical protein
MGKKKSGVVPPASLGMESVVVCGGATAEGGTRSTPTIQSVLLSGRRTQHTYSAAQRASNSGAHSAQSLPTLDALFAKHDPQPELPLPSQKKNSRKLGSSNSSSSASSAPASPSSPSASSPASTLPASHSSSSTRKSVRPRSQSQSHNTVRLPGLFTEQRRSLLVRFREDMRLLSRSGGWQHLSVRALSSHRLRITVRLDCFEELASGSPRLSPFPSCTPPSPSTHTFSSTSSYSPSSSPLPSPQGCLFLSRSATGLSRAAAGVRTSSQVSLPRSALWASVSTPCAISSLRAGSPGPSPRLLSSSANTSPLLGSHELRGRLHRIQRQAVARVASVVFELSASDEDGWPYVWLHRSCQAPSCRPPHMASLHAGSPLPLSSTASWLERGSSAMQVVAELYQMCVSPQAVVPTLDASELLCEAFEPAFDGSEPCSRAQALDALTSVDGALRVLRRDYVTLTGEEDRARLLLPNSPLQRLHARRRELFSALSSLA